MSFSALCGKRAIPEVRRTSPNEDMGILNFTLFFYWEFPQKSNHFFGRKEKEDMGIRKFSSIMVQIMGISKSLIVFKANE